MKNTNLHSFGKIIAKNIFYNNEEVKNKLLALTRKYGFSVLGEKEHNFHPQGFTMIILLAESHISIHTYPENDSAYVDCFTCGNQDPKQFLIDLSKEFNGSIENHQTINRD